MLLPTCLVLRKTVPIMESDAVRAHPFTRAGHRHPEGTGGMVGWGAVTPDYCPALRIPIIRERGFRQEDRLPTENTVILNETLARELFPDANPIGQLLRLFRMQGPWRS